MTQAKKIWKVESTGADKELCKELEYDIDTDDNSTLIARVGTLEDAKLIAAAPEMLENLTRIIERIEENNLQGDFPSAYKRAKELIKKATK